MLRICNVPGAFVPPTPWQAPAAAIQAATCRGAKSFVTHMIALVPRKGLEWECGADGLARPIPRLSLQL